MSIYGRINIINGLLNSPAATAQGQTDEENGKVGDSLECSHNF